MVVLFIIFGLFDVLRYRSETPVSTATGGASALHSLGGDGAGHRKNQKSKKKGPQGPVAGSKYPKLNYRCTGFWKEDHNQVRNSL
jgi:hypothetical protein